MLCKKPREVSQPRSSRCSSDRTRVAEPPPVAPQGNIKLSPCIQGARGAPCPRSLALYSVSIFAHPTECSPGPRPPTRTPLPQAQGGDQAAELDECRPGRPPSLPHRACVIPRQRGTCMTSSARPNAGMCVPPPWIAACVHAWVRPRVADLPAPHSGCVWRPTARWRFEFFDEKFRKNSPVVLGPLDGSVGSLDAGGGTVRDRLDGGIEFLANLDSRRLIWRSCRDGTLFGNGRVLIYAQARARLHRVQCCVTRY